MIKIIETYKTGNIGEFIISKNKLLEGDDIYELREIKSWAEKEYYVNKNNEFIDILSYISYIEKDYHMSYFYSKQLINTANKEIGCFYMCLSLYRLGYTVYAKAIYNENMETIMNFLEKGNINKDHMMEFIIMSEVSEKELPRKIYEYVIDNIQNKRAWLYIIQNKLMQRKTKGDLINLLLKRCSEFEDDKMLLSKLYALLGHFLNPLYYKYADKLGYMDRRAYTDLPYKQDELTNKDLKVFEVDFEKLKRRTDFHMYNHLGEDISIFSYRDIGKMVNMHVINTAEGALVIDCGGYMEEDSSIQRIDAISFLNSCGIDVKKVWGVLISHAHADHYGSFDLLSNEGCSIYMTEHTKNLIYKTSSEYNLGDVFTIKPEITIKIGPFNITPFNNGHILGSCGFDMDYLGKRILYTGDFCIHDQFTLEGMNVDRLKKKGETDYLIIESTYGSKTHEIDMEDNMVIFRRLIESICRNDIKVLLPSFAIGRAQECACMLREGKFNFPVILDGMAGSITYYYERNSKCDDIIGNNISVIMDYDFNEKINKNFVFIASSGMFQKGSTSMKYLEKFLNFKSCVIKVGFMPKDSIPLKILENMSKSFINFYDIPLSAHAGYRELLEVILKLSPENAIVVHGNGIKCIGF